MNKLALALVVVVILLVGIGWAATAHFPNASDSTTSASTTTNASTTTSATSSPVASAPVVATTISDGNSSGNWLADSPAFVGNSTKIDYPPDYGEIANF